LKKILVSEQQKKTALDALDDLKGVDPVCLDISKLSSIADYMIVVTGTSNRHVKSMSEEVARRSKAAGYNVRMEGQEQAEWVLIDLGDVIVHVMQAAIRKLYDLESLWKLSPADR
jgi:ribosome-associated protein